MDCLVQGGNAARPMPGPWWEQLGTSLAGERQAVQGQGLHVDIGCGLWGLAPWKSHSG